MVTVRNLPTNHVACYADLSLVATQRVNQFCIVCLEEIEGMPVFYTAVHGLKISALLFVKKQAIVLIRTSYGVLKYFLQPSYKPADATQ